MRKGKEEKEGEEEGGKTINLPNPWHKDCGSGNVASLQKLSSSCVQTDLELSHTLVPLHTKVITEPQWTVLGSVCGENLQGRREGVEGGSGGREGVEGGSGVKGGREGGREWREGVEGGSGGREEGSGGRA